MFYVTLMLVTVIVLATLAFWPGWTVVYELAIAGVPLVLVVLTMRGVRNRETNYVELTESSFEVVHYSLAGSVHLGVPYSEVESVAKGVRASFFGFLFRPWPYPTLAPGPHVEVHLRKAIRVPLWIRVPPRAHVLHLATERLDELASELRARAGLGVNAP